jgi:hypothetical protein
VPSTLRIADYSHGLMGAAHDASAFENTAAYRFPDFLFEGREFAWTDSAYPLGERVIPVHKMPASACCENSIFDKAVSHLRIRSEHCMGALKGRFQCLRGLRVNINSPDDHVAAMQWITCAIILHNLIIDVEGEVSGMYFQPLHGHAEEEDDMGEGSNEEDDGEEEEDRNPGEIKCRLLIAELLAHRESIGIPF